MKIGWLFIFNHQKSHVWSQVWQTVVISVLQVPVNITGCGSEMLSTKTQQMHQCGDEEESEDTEPQQHHSKPKHVSMVVRLARHQSNSSGLTGCGIGTIDFFSTSRASAFLISITEVKRSQVTSEVKIYKNIIGDNKFFVFVPCRNKCWVIEMV